MSLFTRGSEIQVGDRSVSPFSTLEGDLSQNGSGELKRWCESGLMSTLLHLSLRTSKDVLISLSVVENG